MATSLLNLTTFRALILSADGDSMGFAKRYTGATPLPDVAMRVISSLLIVSFIALVAPSQGFADDSDETLSEREFLQQSIQRLKQVQRRADDYDDYVRALRGGPRRHSRTGIGFETGPSTDRYGRMSGSGYETTLQRMQFDLRTLKRKAGQTLEDLGDMRRETADGDELDRGKINSVIRRLETDADDIERDLRRL